MTKHLLRDIEQLKKAILGVGATVENAIHMATTALLDRRPALAEEVIEGDAEIDTREVAIEEDCLKILALHQPVAFDLRFLITILKVNNDLERMGDLAANIAERALDLAQEPALPRAAVLDQMIEGVRSMVKMSLNALVHQDPEAARTVLAADDEVDHGNRQMFGQMRALMVEDPGTIDRATYMLSVSRNLERIADQATNIAEDVLFLVEGEIIRHRATSGRVLRGPGTKHGD
ncbi:MAG: phosphate signaling complex protein PhoU [Planctomycetota bacterium]